MAAEETAVRRPNPPHNPLPKMHDGDVLQEQRLGGRSAAAYPALPHVRGRHRRRLEGGQGGHGEEPGGGRYRRG